MNKDLQDLDDIADQRNQKPNVGTVVKPSNLKRRFAFNKNGHKISYRIRKRSVTLPKLKCLESE